MMRLSVPGATELLYINVSTRWRLLLCIVKPEYRDVSEVAGLGALAIPPSCLNTLLKTTLKVPGPCFGHSFDIRGPKYFLVGYRGQ